MERRWVTMAGLAVGMGCVVGPAGAAPVVLPASVSLPDELARALRSGRPLVVMVSLDGCVFCRLTRENYLGPMQVQQNLPVVQVDMRSNQPVRNFAGAVVTHDELVRSWGIKIAPTVLFFGSGGLELAERLVGGMLPDFYGAYLDDRLELAKKKIAQPSRP